MTDPHTNECVLCGTRPTIGGPPLHRIEGVEQTYICNDCVTTDHEQDAVSMGAIPPSIVCGALGHEYPGLYTYTHAEWSKTCTRCGHTKLVDH